MKFRSLDSNWDWDFGKGTSSYANDSLAVAYDVKSKVLSWLGDCFFAADEGIDWKNIIGTKNQKDELDTSIQKIIFENENIVEMTSFESRIENRVYHCVVKFKTIYGETIEVKI